jgi:hypothetical protein
MDKNIMTEADVLEILYNNTTLEEKAEAIRNCGIARYSSIVNSMDLIERTIGKNVVKVAEDKAVNMMAHLLDLMVEIVNTEDYNLFKNRFTVLNIMFYLYKDSSCYDVNLCKFDYLWKRSEGELRTYLTLAVCIHMLCDPETKARNMKLVNIKNIPSNGLLKPVAYSNLSTFYNS